MARKPRRTAAPPNELPVRLPILLNDALDLRAAGPLAADLLARRGQDVAIDASAVQRVGGQCLQVLLSARMTWAADGMAFRVVTPSPEFTEGVALMGAAELALAQDV